MPTQRKTLGSGLSALISEDNVAELDQAFIPNLDITFIEPNPYQPRIEIDPENLQIQSESMA